jgi:hypothetical protein
MRLVAFDYGDDISGPMPVRLAPHQSSKRSGVWNSNAFDVPAHL